MAAQSGDALARPPVAAPGRDGVTVDHSRNDLIGADSDQGAYRIDDFGWCVVAIHFLRLTPSMPSAFMSRATRFAPTLALRSKLGMNPRPTIGASGARVYRTNPASQPHVLHGARRGRPPMPRVEPARRDFEHAAHCSNRMHGLMRRYESEDFFGVVLASLANQAVAFARISRSSCLFSRLSFIALGARQNIAAPALTDPRSCGGIPPDTAVSFSAYGFLPSQRLKCPQKRVNFRLGLSHKLRYLKI